ncbi:metallophosphoesterase [Frigidibacter sp. ROC022]|uniref:metallophosphoesterase n=1 Tax=Frigidibacter sp. ROC022 TaxID=2971796 RepID=UPI00215B6C83|nr:metallophosphoesterase [Frigidibacter sp. ROC022]MCR8724780.1 metallophosphoesterase [Frigidibacter sp. ROC022]
MRTYAIGDIHGHLDPLKAAHERVAADRLRTGDDTAPIVHLGDLVDRGPDSAGVIGHLAEGRARGEPWEVLLGNHDRYFRRFLQTGELIDPLKPDLLWFRPTMGGIETLASYGIDATDDPGRVHAQARAKVPEAHVALLNAQSTHLRRGEALFVHAGIRPGVPLEDQIEDDLVWIREPFLSDRRDHGPLIVHGHTALPTASHHGNRVNIDSSMAFGGHLTVIVIEGREVWELTDQGRQPLRP